jgi:ATP-dependent helicase/nuclease subunit A
MRNSRRMPVSKPLHPADQDLRRQALDPASSFIVEAPAGSGKTGLLTQRYLALLAVVDRPESVVAMTFGRKAATEMRERVEHALAAAYGPEPKSDYERQTRELARAVLCRDAEKHWNLLADSTRLQILTIDALCAMLARRMPLASQAGGIGNVVEDASEFYRLAARRALLDLAAGDSEGRALLSRLCLHFDNDLDMLHKQIARMLEHREQWWFLASARTEGNAEDFRCILDRAREALAAVFRERGVIDFAEVTRAAIKALGPEDRPSDLLYWLDYRIEHLLIDEFQDTSRAQYELIHALTREWSASDNKSLFLVGDPMQSIYRFREAEVSLFLRCWDEQRLGNVPLISLRLVTNFRSTPEIVDWTERTFAPIMDQDDIPHGSVKFRPAVAARPAARLHPKLIPLIDEPAREPEEIVAIISSAPPGSSIAILVRNRSHIAQILPALERAAIPYEAVEIERLGEQQHVLDCLSLTRALLHLGDRAAWLACLRAPWCGLSLRDLATLAENEPGRTIFDLLSDPAKIHALEPAARLRAVRLQEIFSLALARQGRVPLRDLVESAWLALGGPAVLDSASQLEDAETFFALLEQLDTGGSIHAPAILEERLECLFARPRSVDARVQVMTIHKAKGLEFDIVILPKLERGSGQPDRDLLIWTEIQQEGETFLAIAPQPRRGEAAPLYKQILDEIKQKSAHELKRLLYVAVTRAKNELYLLASAERNVRNTACKKPREGTFLRLMWPGVEDIFESARRLQRPVSLLRAASNTALTGNVLRRLPATWTLPAFERSIEWQPQWQTATAASTRKVTYEWVSDTARLAGTLAHDLLKRIAREGASAWTEARLSAAKPLLASDLRRLGVPRAECESAAERIIRGVRNALQSERGRWILAARAGAHSEWPVGGVIGERLISGTVDRLFRDEQGKLWIVDFKTSEHEGGQLEKFLDEQQRRYRAQMESYAALLARSHPGPVWLGLYFPLLDAWREWRFEEVAATGHYTVH